MAIASVGSIGSVNSKTANQSSLTCTIPSSNTAVGNFLVGVWAVDNNQTTDGDEGAITSVTDTGGNLWKKAGEFTNGQGTAQTGAVSSLWWTPNITTAMNAAGDTVVANFSNNTSRDAAAARIWKFTKTADRIIGLMPSSTGVLVGTLATDGATAAGSLNLTPRQRDSAGTQGQITFLKVRSAAYESSVGNLTWTVTASWTALTKDGTTGSTGNTNMTVGGEFRITATDGASNPTGASTSADWASVYANFWEAESFIWNPIGQRMQWALVS